MDGAVGAVAEAAVAVDGRAPPPTLADAKTDGAAVAGDGGAAAREDGGAAAHEEADAAAREGSGRVEVLFYEVATGGCCDLLNGRGPIVLRSDENDQARWSRPPPTRPDHRPERPRPPARTPRPPPARPGHRARFTGCCLHQAVCTARALMHACARRVAERAVGHPPVPQVHARGAKAAVVRTGEELRSVLRAALAMRSTVETEANPISSRSHAIWWSRRAPTPSGEP
eukprot:5977611-Prymnesium_polylepis.1